MARERHFSVVSAKTDRGAQTHSVVVCTVGDNTASLVGPAKVPGPKKASVCKLGAETALVSCLERESQTIWWHWRWLWHWPIRAVLQVSRTVHQG